jgi:rRNA maturation endonuclease Nob1
MTSLERTIMREIATLPESNLMDVLTFVRFLKVSLPDKEKTRSEFKEALKDARKTAKKYKITQADINAEIRAVRDGK